jgi:hypothetical protein
MGQIDTEGLNLPQVYGEVIQADPPDGTLEWKIRVRPAARTTAASVQVLRTKLNAERVGTPKVASNSTATTNQTASVGRVKEE